MTYHDARILRLLMRNRGVSSRPQIRSASNMDLIVRHRLSAEGYEGRGCNRALISTKTKIIVSISSALGACPISLFTSKSSKNQLHVSSQETYGAFWWEKIGLSWTESFHR